MNKELNEDIEAMQEKKVESPEAINKLLLIRM